MMGRRAGLNALAGTLVSVLLSATSCASDAEPGPRPDGGTGDFCTRCGACSQQLPVTGWSHLPGPIDYPDSPPASGNHDACWARWGVHESEVPARNWVHNLEHGGVVLLHHCPDGCAADLEAFTNLARQKQRTLLTPYAALPTRFAIVAWGHRLLSDCLDLEAFAAFYAARFDQGLESIASGPPAGCPQ
jgi:hypothetical protein